MRNKRLVVSLCAALLVLLVILPLVYRDKPNVGVAPAEVEERPTRQVILVVTPTPEPLQTSAQKTTKGITLPFQITWQSNGLPVAGASLTLFSSSDESFPEHISTRTTGKSDVSGSAKLALPLVYSEAKNRYFRLSINHPDSAHFVVEGRFIAKQMWSTRKVYPISLRKNGGIFGTVYWRPDGAKYVPAPGATVVGVENVSLSQSMAEKPKSCEFNTITDAQGRYSFQGLPFVPQQVWACLNEHTMLDRPQPLMPELGKPTKPFDIYLEPGVTLAALVSDKVTLKPISGAMVTAVYSEGNFTRSATTGADGFCQVDGLSFGPIWISAGADGYALEQIPLDVSTGENREVPFFLAKGGKVRIQTINSNTEQFEPNIRILLNAPNAGIPILAVTGADGFVVVDGVPISPNVVALTREKGWRGDTRFAVSEDKMATATLSVMPVSQQTQPELTGSQFHTIEGIVVDSAGNPVPSAYVYNFGSPVRRTLTNSAGEFVLERVSVAIYPGFKEPFSFESAVPESVRRGLISREKKGEDLFVRREGHIMRDGREISYYVGPAQVTVESDGFAMLAKTFAAVEGKTVIVLPEKNKGILTARVLDKETGNPVTDYLVTSYPVIRKRVLSEDGTFTFTGFSPQYFYDLNIQAEGYVAKKLKRKPGETPEDILLEPLQFVNVIVLDGETKEPVNGVNVRQFAFDTPKDWSHYQSVYMGRSYVADYITDDDGIFVFKKESLKGGLLFIPTKHQIFSIPLTELEDYRDSESGMIKIFLPNPTASVSVNYVLGPRIFDMETASLSLVHAGNTVRENMEIPKPSYESGIWRWDNLCEGEYRLSGQLKTGDERWDVSRFRLLSSENKHLTLGEGYSATLMGRVYQSNGEPYPSVKVSFSSAAGDWFDKTHLAAITGEGGTYRIAYLPPGEYVVSLWTGTDFKTELKGPWPIVHAQMDTVQDFSFTE